MEADLGQSMLQSPYFDTNKFQKQVDLIKSASEAAQKKIDYYSAHNEDILRAIDVVEEFLRDKHRLCYGGQAINAHLPKKYKIYNPEYSIPDYDFFTPDQAADIKLLAKLLRKAGFTEISAREGMHEGTVKIYVDFVPVADITVIDSKLYRILSKKEYRYEGISYLDANTLRMLMYLELSRPRGEVTRWEKVYERLSLFNEFVPMKYCHSTMSGFKDALSEQQTQFVINYIIDNRRLFAGADLINFYKNSLFGKKQSVDWIINNKKPIIFLSINPDEDAKQIRNFFSETHSASPNSSTGGGTYTIKSVSSKGAELIPTLKIVRYKNKNLVFIVKQDACMSYFNITVDSNKLLKIASIDSLITLYFSLGLLDTQYMNMGSIECLANELVQVSIKARKNPEQFPFPFISIKCIGHQQSLPSLIRAKVKRITQKRKNLANIIRNNTDRIRNTVKSTKLRSKSTRSKSTRSKSSKNPFDFI